MFRYIYPFFSVCMAAPDVTVSSIKDIEEVGYEFDYLQYNTPMTWYEALERCPTWNPTGRLANVGHKDTFTPLQDQL